MSSSSHRLRLLGSPGLLVLGLLALVACQSRPELTQTRERNDAVPASAARATVLTGAEPSHAPVAASAPTSRALCEALETPTKAQPPVALTRKAAPGASLPPDSLGGPSEQWTWINLWAAWCVPCKAEIPHLLEWRRALAGSARLEFVSFDDDQRQLETFLASQGDDGLTSTYWATEGEQRKQWLEAMGLVDEPELPTHILLDAEGRRRCVVHGVVEKDEFARVKSLLTRHP